MAGDDMRDVQAGINAGCTPVFLTEKTDETPLTENGKTILTFTNLLQFTESCLHA
jgi:histidinol phosphatase-like enzyme